MKFKEYMKKKEDEDSENDIKKTLDKIPKNHAELVKDYKIIFQPNNSLKGDSDHIGLIDEKNKKIVIAAPWNYGREYTLLHEVGHAVWKYVLDEKKKQQWNKLLKKVKKGNEKDLNQNAEEIFCMSYAQKYAKNKLEKFDHKDLINFISKL